METNEKPKTSVVFKEHTTMEDHEHMYFGEYDEQDDCLSEESIKIAEPKFECGICTQQVVGYCRVCEEYLCEYCLLRHKKRRETSSHHVYHFYCSDHIKVNKIQIADRYCTGCSVYFCEKCATMHLGFRKWRKHTFSKGLDMPFVDTMNFTSSDQSHQRKYQHHQQQQQQRGSRMASSSAKSSVSRNTLKSGYKTKPSIRK